MKKTLEEGEKWSRATIRIMGTQLGVPLALDLYPPSVDVEDDSMETDEIAPDRRFNLL
jgi:hypothetical protein